jgi:chromosome segregation ATPase
MRKLIIVASFGVLLSGRAEATMSVIDISSIAHNLSAQIANYVQYVEHTLNQLTQIENQTTQITNQVTQLRRFGDPNYYVNVLGLDSFMSTATTLTSGVGSTIAEYRQAANGVMALQYTGNGLYSNLQGTVDRWGNTVQYQPDAFRKFSAVNDMVESYNTQQQTYNAQMASLQQQLANALQKLNSAGDLVTTQKYSAQINAIHAQINALNANSSLGGQRAAIQQLSNQNDAARVQEASREQEIQERETDLQNEANGFRNLIGGGAGGGILP